MSTPFMILLGASLIWLLCLNEYTVYDFIRSKSNLVALPDI